jgi:VWFA-related protein
MFTKGNPMHAASQSQRASRRPARSRQHTQRQIVAGLLLLLIAAPHGADGQQAAPGKAESQDQTVKLKADLMELRAVVTDKQGKPVTGLKQADFEILENGREQVISFFSAERVSNERVTNLPGTSPAARRPVTPNAPPKRTVAFFVDTLHMSTTSMMRVKQELLKFIDERLGDEDLAAVVATGGGLGLFSQFTSDKRVLRAGINRLTSSPASTSNSAYTPYLAAKVEAEDDTALNVAKKIVIQEEGLSDDPHFDRIVTMRAQAKARQIISETTYQRRQTLFALQSVAERMGEMPGQRMVLFLSDGFTLLDDSGANDSDDLRATISRAARAGVVVYAINAKGLHGIEVYDVSTRLPAVPQIVTAMRDYSRASDRELEAGMERLAKGTGGEAFFTTNDLKGAFGKALDDNGYYYSLAYYPAAAEDKKSFRAIKVRVKSHPDYSVRTQSGYFAGDLLKEKSVAPADPRKALIKVMGEPLASTAIGVDASADFLYLPSDDAQVSVNIFVDARRIGYKEEEKGFVANLTLLTGVLDSAGRTTDVLQDTMQIRLLPEQLERAKESVYRYTKRLRVKPGLYQIRVGVYDPQTSEMGTASTWIEVPDLKSKKLVLSSIATARFQSDSDEAKQGEGRALLQPNVRNGVNVFHRGDSITYYGKAHKAGLGAQNAAGLMIQGQILQDEKVMLNDTWKPLSAFVLNKEADSIEFGGRIRAAGFKPGFYTLRISVKDPQSKEELTRETSFEVAP